MSCFTRRQSLAMIAGVTIPPVTVVGATPVVAPSTRIDALSDLISNHDNTRAQSEQHWQVVEDALRRSDCPPVGWVSTHEFGPDNHRMFGEQKFNFPEQIDTYIDKMVRWCAWQIQHGFSPIAHRERIERLEADRRMMHRLLAARSEVYSTFRVNSGANTAEEEAEALDETAQGLRKQIFAWRCQTLEEARAKAKFIFEARTWINKDAFAQAVEMLVDGGETAQ